MICARRLGPLLLTLASIAPGIAHAQLGCSVGMSSIQFGNVNQIGAPATTVTGTMSLSCSGATQPYVRICIALGAPVDSSWTPRYLYRPDGARMAYNIYTDPGHTQIWGSAYSTAGTQREVDLPMNYGSGHTTLPYYARVPVQNSVGAGTYITTFTYANDAAVRAVEYSDSPPTCNSSMPIVSRFEFGVSGHVAPDCTISASALDFGVVGVELTRKSAQATGSVSIRCLSDLPYSIALDAGNGSGATVAHRLMTRNGSSDTLAYGLYADLAHTQLWGDGSSGTQTVSGTGLGSQLTVPHLVYGKLDAQELPPFGKYRDRITVTITF